MPLYPLPPMEDCFAKTLGVAGSGSPRYTPLDFAGSKPRPGFHDLRRAVGSALVGGGVDPKTVQTPWAMLTLGRRFSFMRML